MVPDGTTPDRDRFFADLAHDLLNALAAIRGQAQLTRRRIRRVDRLSRDHIAGDLERIDAHVERMTGLIDGHHGAERPPRPGGASKWRAAIRPSGDGDAPAGDRGGRR